LDATLSGDGGNEQNSIPHFINQASPSSIHQYITNLFISHTVAEKKAEFVSHGYVAVEYAARRVAWTEQKEYI
jgi:hypothetical protein